MLDRIEGFKATGRKRKRGDFRASDADRADAVRRLEVHEQMGHLRPDEAPALREALKSSVTLNDLTGVFVDANLPELPARSPLTERRISERERDEAVELLDKACAEGRIDDDECAAASERVRVARTRNEIDAAFHGLSTPTRVAASKAASDLARHTARVTSHVAKEGGRRAGKAVRRGVLAVGMLMLAVILAIAGIGIGAFVCFVGSVLLFVGAALSLVTS